VIGRAWGGEYRYCGAGRVVAPDGTEVLWAVCGVGFDGLEDDPRPGPAVAGDEVAWVTHWSARLMADRLEISFASVARHR
jgi:hypothetical protein